MEVAAQATTTSMLAHYDTKNSEALLRLVASGVNVSMFSPQVVQTMYGAAQDHYAGLIASNEAFAAIYKSQKEYRDRNYLYHQYADFQYDNMMLQLLRKA